MGIVEDRLEILERRVARLSDADYWRDRPSWELEQERYAILNAKIDILLETAIDIRMR